MADVQFEINGTKKEGPTDLDEKHPLIYADQIMNIAFGPFVSRVTIGVENPSPNTRTPVATIVMPTNMIHSMMSEISKQISSGETHNKFEKMYKDYLNSSFVK